MADRVRQIGLRFPEEVFEALDKKRWEDKLSFQALGEALFLGWLKEENEVLEIPERPRRGPSADRWNDMLDTVLRHGNPKVADNLKGVLKVFYEQTLLQLESAANNQKQAAPAASSGKARGKSV